MLHPREALRDLLRDYDATHRVTVKGGQSVAAAICLLVARRAEANGGRELGRNDALGAMASRVESLSRLRLRNFRRLRPELNIVSILDSSALGEIYK